MSGTIRRNRKSSRRAEKHHDIVINLSRCKYSIIKSVALEEFGWIESKILQPEKSDWDIFWSDSVPPIKTNLPLVHPS